MRARAACTQNEKAPLLLWQFLTLILAFSSCRICVVRFIAILSWTKTRAHTHTQTNRHMSTHDMNIERHTPRVTYSIEGVRQERHGWSVFGLASLLLRQERHGPTMMEVGSSLADLRRKISKPLAQLLRPLTCARYDS